MNKKTIVIGASPKNDRYSNKAVRLLKNYGNETIALGFEDGKIADSTIETEWKQYQDVDTITLYLNPCRQKVYYNYILSLNPKRIIFNPGTENNELQQLAKSKQIEYLEACTLVMLNTGQY